MPKENIKTQKYSCTDTDMYMLLGWAGPYVMGGQSEMRVNFIKENEQMPESLPCSRP